MKEDSRISLLVEGYPRNGYQTYCRIMGNSTSGLCISRLHPDYVASKYGLDRSKRYWLSGQKGEDVIAPKSLNHLVKVIRSEMRGRSGGKVFLDGLEYLLLFNDMSKVMGMLEEIDSLLKAADVELFVSLDPLTFEQKELDRLWMTYPRYTSEELVARFTTEVAAPISCTAKAQVGIKV